jgi:hypothetical protein
MMKDDFQDAPELRYDLGFAYLVFLGVAVAINMVLIIYEILRFVKLKNQ